MNLRAQLLHFEGRAHAAYPDPVTHGAPWTIGIGHTGPEVHEGLIWTDAQIDAAFEADVTGAEGLCTVTFGESYLRLNEPRRAVLAGMVFQLGMHGVQGFPRFLAAVRDERFQDACAEMLDSKWCRQTPGRVRALAHQMATGEWQTTDRG